MLREWLHWMTASPEKTTRVKQRTTVPRKAAGRPKRDSAEIYRKKLRPRIRRSPRLAGKTQRA